MRLSGSFLSTPLFLVLVILCSFGSALGADPDWAPTVFLPGDTSVRLCEADTICFDLTVTDVDAGDVITVTMLEGPIDYPPQTFGPNFTEIICFEPDTTGLYRFIWQVSDTYGHVVTDTVIFSVSLNILPVIEDQHFSQEVCFAPHPRILPVRAYDPDCDTLRYIMVSGLGTIDKYTGIIEYDADSSGVYTWRIAVLDECTSDTATIYDTIYVNEPPVMVAEDFTVRLCDPEEICFDIAGHDPDAGPVKIFQNTGPGTTTQIDDTLATTCFTPFNVDSASYLFVYCLVDECPLGSPVDEALSTSGCRLDSVIVTVIIDQPPVISSPDSLEFFACKPDTFCFDIATYDPEYGPITYNVLQSGAYIEGNTVCITGTGNAQADIVIEAVDSCGHADTSVITVTIVGNRRPVATMADDLSMTICEPQPICIAAFADDPEFDVADVVVNYGTYDDVTDRVCFDADTSGVYELILTVTDGCGATDVDTAIVTIHINELPVVTLADDFAVSVCEGETVCFDAFVADDNPGMLIVAPGFAFDSAGSSVCFVPDSSGVYEAFVRLTDDCDNVVEDRILITVDFNSGPVISPIADTTVYLCAPTMICLPVQITDADKDIVSITSNFGEYNADNGTICFVPYNGEQYEIILTVTDACGLTADDTAMVTVLTDQGIVLECPEDVTMFLCEPDTLCFPVGGIPEGATVEVSGTGAYWNAETQSVCFYSDCCIENTLTVSATTECGTYTCSFTVNIQTNSSPLVILPQDSSFVFCEPTEIRLPLGASDPDGNLMEVVVDGAGYDSYRGEMFFTPDTTGLYIITVTATDSCGAVDSDQVMLEVVVNTAPIIEAVVPDSAYRQCELAQISIPIAYYDAELGSVLTVTTNIGEIVNGSDSTNSELLITPNQFGEICVEIVATDECGAADTINFCITVEQGDFVSLACPIVEPAELCDTATIFIPFDITGANYTINASYGEIVEGGINIFADTTGRYLIDIIADAECNADTCQIDLSVDISEPVVLGCPSDTNVFVCASSLIPMEFSISGTYNFFEIVGPAYLDSSTINRVMVEVGSSGDHVVTLIAYGDCYADTCTFTVSAEFNSAPTVSANDSSVVFCEISEICLPILIEDIDSNIESVVSSMGEIVDGSLCFMAPDFGDYDIVLTVTDSCGLVATDTVSVSVIQGEFVSVVCPTVAPVELCGPGQVCFPIDISGSNYQVYTDFGVYAEGEICFDADTSGQYAITVIGDAGCNSDTCTVLVDVTVTEPVTLTCQTNDSTVFFCEAPGHMMFPVEFTGDDVQLTVLPAEAWYENGFVHINVDSAGVYDFEIIGTNSCNADTCSFSATAIYNTPPELNASFDTTIVACDLETICLPFAVTDIDDNLIEVRATLGVVNDTIVCFTPDAYGDYEIIVTAVDACDETVVDTIMLSVVEGSRAEVTCPVGPLFLNVPTPSEVRIPVAISPVDAQVTVLPFGEYDATTGEIVVFFDSTGVWNFSVIAEAYCNRDSCEFEVQVDQYFSPKVVCSGSVDTVACVSEPTTICLPFSYSGTDAQVVVKPIGTIVGNTVCIEVDQAGEYIIELIAFNDTEADTCATILVVLDGDPAQVTLPQDYSVALCGPQEICLPVDIIATDFGIQAVDAGFAQYNADLAEVCFFADTAGTYEVVVVALDSCTNLSSDTVLVTVEMNIAPVVTLPEDYFTKLCGPEQLCVDLTVFDLNLADVTSNIGTVNLEAGNVCLETDGPGSYALIVTATDSCGLTAADTIVIDVEQNQAPTIQALADKTVYLCNPQYVCINAYFDDVDGNIADVSVNMGQYSAEDGTICFVPYGEGTYDLILTVTDSCGLTAVDTAQVIVKTDQGLVIDVPNDTSFFLCEADTVCFPVGGIPAGAAVEVSGTGTWWDAATQSICFYSDCCIDNLLTVSVTTDCGTYSESFMVTILTNSKPLVIIPSDSTLLQCEPAPICFPIGVSDQDGNLMSVTVDGAVYDDYRDEACFTPDGSGTYTITVTATDSCGATDVDQIIFNVTANEAPTVAFNVDQTFLQQCTFEEVCLPVEIEDLDGNLERVVTTFGEYRADGSSLCFMPDTFGVYCIDITAYDSCGVSSTDRICITIAEGDYVAIDCPTGPLTTDTLCAPTEICNWLYITGDNFEVTTSFGSWADGKLCFDADTSGIYEIMVIATSQCVTDTCIVTQPVKILEPVWVVCPEDQNEFLCGRDTLRYDFTASESVTNISVSSPAYIEGNQVVIPIFLEGTLDIRMIASGKCGKDTCNFTVTTDFNVPPVIVDGRDTSLVECALKEVCLPLNISDADGNIQSVTSSAGTINEAGDKLCFTPAAYGVYEITITVTDSCGVTDSDVVQISFLEGDYASIICPEENQFVALCEPDTICIVAPIMPLGAAITILPNGIYKPESGEICVWVDQGGSMPITIIAESQCATDTCEFILEVEMGSKPTVSSPATIDTLLCLAEAATLCFPIEVSGTGVQVNVNPIGEFSAGTVCLPIDTAGTYEIEIIAFGTCGVDTSHSIVIVTADQLPVLTLPEDITIERCPDDTNTICIDGIFGTDAESDLTLTQVCGPGTFGLAEPDSGGICWLPEVFGQSEFCFELTDGCHTVTGSFMINIVTKSDCEVCVRATIDGGASIPVGLRKTVAINVETNDEIAGFDILISYDASALTFVGATLDETTIEEWEYFTYNSNNAACGGSCPSGLVRFVGIADVNNGANHPPESAYSPEGTLLYMQFQISNDQNLESQFIPISFVWYDCGDNTFSDASGSLLYMDLRIFGNEGMIIWDEFDDVNYPEASRPFGMGAADECLLGTEKGQPLRCIDFINGGIKIIPVDSIDDRGDINLDGLAYTIADAVLFTNYFIDGLIVFKYSIPGQIAATDVNADGITLSVADLVLLIRVVVGDADPTAPKLNPYPQDLVVSTKSAGDGKLTIQTDAVASIGAAHFVYNIPEDMAITDVYLTHESAGMDIEYAVDDGQLRVIVYDIGENSIAAGKNDIISIDYTGSGSLEADHLEFADFDGRPYRSVSKGLSLPTQFELNQNYPNPFNPTTTISFDLAQAGSWELQIYNVTGKLVRSYEGFSAAGPIEVTFDGTNANGSQVASGIYLYRLKAGDFSKTKKMILLK